MKYNVACMWLMVSFILLTSCQEKSQLENKKEDSPQLVLTSKKSDLGTHQDQTSPDPSEALLSGICSSLKDDYVSLITKINNNKDDKVLIQELIAWTKKPSHLDCLENSPNYNSIIEELNQTL